MITDGKKWHYLTVKYLPALLRGLTSSHVGNFYFLNCFYSYSTRNKLKKHKNVCENCDYRCIEIPKKDNKILNDNHGEKSMKVPFVVYADL